MPSTRSTTNRITYMDILDTGQGVVAPFGSNFRVVRAREILNSGFSAGDPALQAGKS